jgi:hypothetical protein
MMTDIIVTIAFVILCLLAFNCNPAIRAKIMNDKILERYDLDTESFWKSLKYVKNKGATLIILPDIEISHLHLDLINQVLNDEKFEIDTLFDNKDSTYNFLNKDFKYHGDYVTLQFYFYLFEKYNLDGRLYVVPLDGDILGQGVLGQNVGNYIFLNDDVILKTIRHELYHSYGLNHCEDHNCLMYPYLLNENQDDDSTLCEKHIELMDSIYIENSWY